MTDAPDEYQALQALSHRYRRDLQLDLHELRHLLVAARALQPLLRRAAPLLPYAATTAGIALLVVLMRRGRAPPALIAAGAALDALRAWTLLRR